MTRQKTLQNLTLCALFAAITAVLSQVSVPLPWGVPLNMGLVGVYTASGLLGAKRGTAGIFVYVLLGAAGLPVFAGFRSGPEALFGATGGYIAGYILTALAIGLAADRWGRSVKTLIPAMAVGTLLTYLSGTVWFVYMYAGKYSFGAALTLCVVPYLIGDAAKIILSSMIVERVCRSPADPM